VFFNVVFGYGLHLPLGSIFQQLGSFGSVCSGPFCSHFWDFTLKQVRPSPQPCFALLSLLLIQASNQIKFENTRQGGCWLTSFSRGHLFVAMSGVPTGKVFDILKDAGLLY